MQLIICDLDDCLVNDIGNISEFDLKMLSSWSKQGNKFTILTALSYQQVCPYITKLKISERAILYGGGVLFDFEKDVPLIVEFADALRLKMVTRFIYRNHLNIVPLLDKIHTICVPKNKQLFLSQFMQENELMTLKLISNFSKISYNGVVKLTAIGNTEDLNRLETYLTSFNYSIKATKNYIDILPKNLSIKPYIDVFLKKYSQVYVISKSKTILYQYDKDSEESRYKDKARVVAKEIMKTASLGKCIEVLLS